MDDYENRQKLGWCVTAITVVGLVFNVLLRLPYPILKKNTKCRLCHLNVDMVISLMVGGYISLKGKKMCKKCCCKTNYSLTSLQSTACLSVV